MRTFYEVVKVQQPAGNGLAGFSFLYRILPDVEVWHVIQKTRNASVACNASFCVGE